MSMELLINLSKDLSQLLTDTKGYNMIINVGEKGNFKTFHVHSTILRVRSPYFRTALSGEWAKIENNLLTFNKPNISPIVFEVILKYIYTGQITLDDYETPVILDLLVAADELDLQELIDHTEDYLLCYKPSWMQRNFATTHRIAFQHSSTFKKLREYCSEIIRNDPELIFQAEDFPMLDENVLINLLRRNDLLVNEILLWENVIKWGIYQSRTMIQQQRDDHDEQFVICNKDGSSSSPRQLVHHDFDHQQSNRPSSLCKRFSSLTNPFKDLTQWTSREFRILGATLDKCIPLIRYLQISSGDFYKKVKPFSSMLPVELYEEILQYHLVPGHQPSYELTHPKRAAIDSVIIERKHAALIASWIDRRDLCNGPDGVRRANNIGGNNGYTNFRSIDKVDESVNDDELSSGCYEPWDNPYEFKLLLRGSRDGFTGAEFHAKCDSQAATVTVLRVRGTGEIIGGFTPIRWLSQNTWGYTDNSFIFCLASSSPSTSADNAGIRTRTNISSFTTTNIVSRVCDPTRAINYYQNYGPSFGRDDLKMAGNFRLESRCCCKQGDYEFRIREDTNCFSVDEYEVFQVLPRKSGPSEFTGGGMNGVSKHGGSELSGSMVRSLTY